MLKRILVPLDGSSRAERAILVAARIARATHGSVLLLQAVGIPPEYSTYLYGSYIAQTPVFAQEVLDSEKARAEEYLSQVMKLDALTGVEVETRALIGAAATTIQDIALEEHVDLIVMCSHGDTGFKRWVLGSVAQKLSRQSQVPVLVLHERGSSPDSAFPDPLRPLRSLLIQVALDGSDFAEAAIEPAAQLVGALATPAKGMLLLTRVVPLSTTGNLANKEQALSEARTYLSRAAQRFEKVAAENNIMIKTSLAIGKDVAETLIRSAEQAEEVEGKRLIGSCDAIAITTHGRGGLQRLTMGSVTERLLGATKLPLLVVHNVTTQRK